VKKIFNLLIALCFLYSTLPVNIYAQENTQSKPEPVAATPITSSSQNVTLDFKDADINSVLKIISYKAGVNIITTPEVMGNVTIRLMDVPWEGALDVILKTYGFGYQKQGNIILVTKQENMTKIQSEEPLQTEIVTLKFLDAQDAQKIIIPLLTSRGKIAILYTRGQKGWQFGTFKIGKSTVSGESLQRERMDESKEETFSIEKTADGNIVSRKAKFESSIKSKTLVITDTASAIDRIKNVIIPQIDRKPKQVLIETRLIEVNRDRLKDIGFDWGLGSTGNAETSTVTTGSIAKDPLGLATQKIGGHVLGSEVAPSVFGPKETVGPTAFSGTEPYTAGAEFIFQKLTGTKFEAILHAIEEDAHTNTLSAPRVMTLDNQEASILVGYHTPIIKSEISGGTSSTDPTKLTQSLDYYQEIGIRLNVVPQINEEGYINMIIHPVVTSSSANVTATSYVGTTSTTVAYPIIDVREAQTQILMKNDETVVLGGLLKDVQSKEIIGVPILSSIPFIGTFFRREVNDTAKVDLLIFIKAHIIDETELSADEIAQLQDELGKDRVIKKEAASKVKAKDKAKVEVKVEVEKKEEPIMAEAIKSEVQAVNLQPAQEVKSQPQAIPDVQEAAKPQAQPVEQSVQPVVVQEAKQQ